MKVKTSYTVHFSHLNFFNRFEYKSVLNSPNYPLHPLIDYGSECYSES